ncbi:hypothetical protein C8J57DRAFT_1256071 [Mycena rebaudengoi]|nr:hypothetical protein C8J57DRAFT_1262528 [Mycena rebaudengoi]KAJ7213264.1 hypothetical protein C8J57DRAFT_1256071 [Mycena rebaudengoi]
MSPSKELSEESEDRGEGASSPNKREHVKATSNASGDGKRLRDVPDSRARSEVSSGRGRRNIHLRAMDPHGELVGILKGCSSLEELHIAWFALSKQFELGQEYLQKYQAEYGTLVACEDPKEKLTLFYEQVLHHNEDLPGSLGGKEINFQDVADHIVVPDRLRAFPLREMEERLSMVFYSAVGERFESPLSSRSSCRGGDDFEVPCDKEALRKDLGARQVSIVELAKSTSKGKAKAVESESQQGCQLLLLFKKKSEIKEEGMIAGEVTNDHHGEEQAQACKESLQVVRYLFIAPGTPYRSIVLTIEPKLKVENLLEWDGVHSSVINYFWNVGQLATLGRWLPEALGYWLLPCLKKGLLVQSWFSMLSSARQAQMCLHYTVFLQIIKEKFLRKRWQLIMNTQFEQQAFRQEGYKHETPQMFISRRMRHIRMLANADNSSPLEVFLIMRRAPLQWSMVIVLQNILSTKDLYDSVNDHWEALVESTRRDRDSDTLTVHNLGMTL